MGKPETRSLFGHSRGGVAVVIDQTPIPWCITHDSQVAFNNDVCPWWDEQHDCNISTGGPDHKWWVDK